MESLCAILFCGFEELEPREVQAKSIVGDGDEKEMATRIRYVCRCVCLCVYTFQSLAPFYR